ncbi:hypothetical protein E27107_530010 [Elizabethkingia anophelis]|nr:hypothetical protein E18064_430002 [Elizabethkingia anophelis]CDN79382.1 hypothetical protein E27107_530010 [Elizabethkingia anophelis]
MVNSEIKDYLIIQLNYLKPINKRTSANIVFAKGGIEYIL